MCPYYKLNWFKKRGYSDADIKAIKNLVHSMFNWMSNFSIQSQEPQSSDTPSVSNQTVNLFVVLPSLHAVTNPIFLGIC
jgi:hypothetical protein